VGREKVNVANAYRRWGVRCYGQGMAKVRRKRKAKVSLKVPSSQTSSTYVESKRRQLEATAKRRDPRLKRGQRNAAVFIGLAVVVQIIIVSGQFSFVFLRGMAGRYQMAMQFSVLLLLVLATLCGFVIYRRPWIPTLTANLAYLAYIPLAWLIDRDTGTWAFLLQGVAMIALLRALASAFVHRKVWRELHAGPESVEAEDGPLAV